MQAQKFDENPLRVQEAPAGSDATPLVLIHDGGGTTFGYFSLGSLGRDAWAIHNPRYYSTEDFSGGMDEMARRYVDLMLEAGIQGRILLGGWSLGGYLSLAIARLLADEPAASITIEGLLLIDSPYHVPHTDLPEQQAEPNFDNLPPLVQKALDDCDELLDTWTLPSWSNENRTATLTVGDKRHVLHGTEAMHRPLEGEWTPLESSADSTDKIGTAHGPAPPPGVLLRCTNRVPPKDASDTAPVRVDNYRDDVLLGWRGRYPAFIRAVVDVDADHYGIFGMAKIKQVTEKVKLGLEALEGIEDGPERRDSHEA
ncbi:hypothetical protein ANO11243_073490 [Dothideomycetidae sp. 11243]|nr:hypothetical protein ANO11243_073490 [fungal sp. No.11243]